MGINLPPTFSRFPAEQINNTSDILAFSIQFDGRAELDREMRQATDCQSSSVSSPSLSHSCLTLGMNYRTLPRHFRPTSSPVVLKFMLVASFDTEDQLSPPSFPDEIEYSIFVANAAYVIIMM